MIFNPLLVIAVGSFDVLVPRLLSHGNRWSRDGVGFFDLLIGVGFFDLLIAVGSFDVLVPRL